MTKSIREILYLDFDKASSIRSQFEEGLTERIDEQTDREDKEELHANAGIPKLLEGGARTDLTKRRSTLEVRKLHHDILNFIERKLTDSRLITDFSDWNTEDATLDELRSSMRISPFIRASGQAEFEDYDRMEKFIENYEPIINVIRSSVLNSSEGYVSQKERLAEIHAQLKSASKPDRTRLHDERKKIEGSLNAIEEAAIKPVENELLQNISTIISGFYRERIILRITQNIRNSPIEVLCNLKRDSFTDQNIEHLLYGYGVYPDVDLSVFGVVTSMPNEEEQESSDDSNSPETITSAFRNVFRAFGQLDDHFRPVSFPHLMVHPIAIYREFTVEK